jgi:hypothetical protein
LTPARLAGTARAVPLLDYGWAEVGRYKPDQTQVESARPLL